jgi:hypothetical protein
MQMFNISRAGLLNRFRVSATLNCTASRLFAGAVLFLGVLQQSGATTIQYKSFNDLVAEADAVVSGQVVSVESRFSSNKEDIYTFVTLKDVETLSGSYSASTVTLRLLGGYVGDKILDVAGSPGFRPNERVIIFVQGNGRNMVPIVGWSQGVFRIRNDAGTGLPMMVDHDGNRVFGLQGGTVIKERIHRSEATIVYPQGVQVATGSDANAHAGLPDYIAPAERDGLAAGQQPSSPGLQAVMSPAAFVSAIRNAAQSRSGSGTLQSVGPNDVDVTSNNSDASIGRSTGPTGNSGSQAPVLPKPAKPEAPAVQQQ